MEAREAGGRVAASWAMASPVPVMRCGLALARSDRLMTEYLAARISRLCRRPVSLPVCSTAWPADSQVSRTARRSLVGSQVNSTGHCQAVSHPEYQSFLPTSLCSPKLLFSLKRAPSQTEGQRIRFSRARAVGSLSRGTMSAKVRAARSLFLRKSRLLETEENILSSSHHPPV